MERMGAKDRRRESKCTSEIWGVGVRRGSGARAWDRRGLGQERDSMRKDVWVKECVISN